MGAAQQASSSPQCRYDVVVVGAGSAGACLSARLAEAGQVQVLLLEAGPDYRSDETPPHLRSLHPVEAFFDQNFQWPGLLARRTPGQAPRPYLRGRGVGGSSAINAQIAIRGLPADYDGWEAAGARGWSYGAVLEAFCRLEDDLDFPDSPYHGRGGPVPVMRQRRSAWGPVDNALADAACDLGYGWCEDHNAPVGTGVSPLAFNGRNGRRVSTNDAYLETARSRPNLTVVGGALVDRVLFEGKRAKRASGVRFRLHGTWREVAAANVVLCAGAVHSPAILVRSGIGPTQLLRELGIRCLSNLPVGEGFTDHPTVFFPLVLRPDAQPPEGDRRHLNCYVRYGSGLEGGGENDMFLASLNSAGPAGPMRALGGLAVGLHEPRSRGRLIVRSSDPDAQPYIDSCLLTDPSDLARMRDGVERLLEILHHPATTAVAELVTYGFTGRSIDELADGKTIESWLLAQCDDVSHAAGTCRMGPDDDPRSVLDPRCRVLGVDGLRVVDASIMPEIPRANTHLTTVMIAEHAAAMMRSDEGMG